MRENRERKWQENSTSGWGRSEEVLGDHVPLQLHDTSLRPHSARVEGQVGSWAREEPSDL